MGWWCGDGGVNGGVNDGGVNDGVNEWWCE